MLQNVAQRAKIGSFHEDAFICRLINQWVAAVKKVKCKACPLLFYLESGVRNYVLRSWGRECWCG